MAKALTEFGTACRRLRAARNLIMADQARALQVSSAFVSSVETGAKSIPSGYVARVAEWLRLKGEEAAQLHLAADASSKVVKIHPTNGENAKLVVALAQSIEKLSPKQIRSLRLIIGKGAE